MMKLMSALARGRVHDAGERLADANARTILDQQIRDSAEATESARKAAALASLRLTREENDRRALGERIADLETRVVEALGKGLDDLAREGAEEIAFLERERDLSDRTISEIRQELSRRRPLIKDHELRLRRLTRGRDLVAFRSETRRLNEANSAASRSTLPDAEATLARMEERQAVADLAATEREEMTARCADDVAGRLATAGCGPARKGSADAVLERLRAAAPAAPSEPSN